MCQNICAVCAPAPSSHRSCNLHSDTFWFTNQALPVTQIWGSLWQKVCPKHPRKWLKWLSSRVSINVFWCIVSNISLKMENGNSKIQKSSYALLRWFLFLWKNSQCAKWEMKPAVLNKLWHNKYFIRCLLSPEEEILEEAVCIVFLNILVKTLSLLTLKWGKLWVFHFIKGRKSNQPVSQREVT